MSEPSFVQFLHVIGFTSWDGMTDKTAKEILTPDLFQLANRAAFQKVSLLLLFCSFCQISVHSFDRVVLSDIINQQI